MLCDVLAASVLLCRDLSSQLLSDSDDCAVRVSLLIHLHIYAVPQSEALQRCRVVVMYVYESFTRYTLIHIEFRVNLGNPGNYYEFHASSRRNLIYHPTDLGSHSLNRRQYLHRVVEDISDIHISPWCGAVVADGDGVGYLLTSLHGSLICDFMDHSEWLVVEVYINDVSIYQRDTPANRGGILPAGLRLFAYRVCAGGQ